MSPAVHEFLVVDLAALLTGTLAAITCGLLGNFLVLRRLSLVGDAISHAVLPGLVAGFLISGSRSSGPMFLGAAAAGVATVALVEVIRRTARLESGAAMGVVFTVMFALGVLLIERAAARGVDLDADCVFNGQLETVFWESAPREWSALLDPATYGSLPRQLLTLAATAAAGAVLVIAFFKELRICSFDPALATALGISSRLVHSVLMLLVAAAVVASFEAVGSILVVAMLICPAATARLLTDRLAVQVWLSVAIAAMVGLCGYVLAAYGRAWLGGSGSLSAAGMMTVAAGSALVLAIVAAPEYGILPRALRRVRAAANTAREDLLGLLYRAEEAGRTEGLTPDQVHGALAVLHGAGNAVRAARRAGEVALDDGRIRLTGNGRTRAKSMVRVHRLWEGYLVRELGLRPDHVHERAEALEHVTGPGLAARLGDELPATTDPHGRPIPGR